MMDDNSAVEELIYHEARLLDDKAFDEWLELLTDDVLYWAPLKRGQTEDEIHNSLFFEDLLVLRIRIERLRAPRVFSQEPPSYCQHVLQKPQVEKDPQGHICTSTPFVYVEAQLDEQIFLAGSLHHQIVHATTGGLKIRRKRIELLNRDAALPSIQLLI